MSLDNMNQDAINRHSDALFIQEGACNLSGVARSLVRAINQCQHQENMGTQKVRDDAAIRMIVHQMAFLCNVGEIDSASNDVYGRLQKECQEKSEATKKKLAEEKEKAKAAENAS
jgi:hypothetical protein